MRAVMHRCYGVPTVLRVERIAKPTPNDDQVLIKVHAASVNPAEWHRITGQPLLRLEHGIGAPEGLGAWDTTIAGIVEAVGANVTRFKPGDEVFGGAGGALAEYVVAREQGAIVPKPPNMSFEEAAAHSDRRHHRAAGPARSRSHRRRAEGARSMAPPAASEPTPCRSRRRLGAEVTGVCSTRNVELVRSLGADHVIDYTKENFTETTERYDLILDNVGNHRFCDLDRHHEARRHHSSSSADPKNDPLLGPI